MVKQSNKIGVILVVENNKTRVDINFFYPKADLNGIGMPPEPAVLLIERDFMFFA